MSGAPANVTPVEHACYKCQASVEEGVPFCPHCGAPQIRVAPPEPQEQTASPEQPLPSIQQSNSPWGTPRASYTSREPIHWNQAWQGAALAGVGAGVLSLVPFLALGSLIWMAIAGAISVAMYQRRVPAAMVRPGMGMRIGALAGAFAFAIIAVRSAVSFATEGNQLRDMLQEQMRASIARSPDPGSQQMLEQFLAKLTTPEGMATFFLWVLLLMAIVFILCAAVGGALRASISARRRGLS